MLSSKLMKATHDYATYDRPIPAPYLRKTFVLDTVPDSALITLTCTGFYRLWINSVEITNGRLAPYISNPDQWRCLLRRSAVRKRYALKLMKRFAAPLHPLYLMVCEVASTTTRHWK